MNRLNFTKKQIKCIAVLPSAKAREDYGGDLSADWLTLYAEVERLSEIEARMNLKVEEWKRRDKKIIDTLREIILIDEADMICGCENGVSAFGIDEGRSLGDKALKKVIEKIREFVF